MAAVNPDHLYTGLLHMMNIFVNSEVQGFNNF